MCVETDRATPRRRRPRLIAALLPSVPLGAASPRLTPRLISTLTAGQKRVLRIGRDFELDPAFAAERDRETAVRWGTADEELVPAKL